VPKATTVTNTGAYSSRVLHLPTVRIVLLQIQLFPFMHLQLQ